MRLHTLVEPLGSFHEIVFCRSAIKRLGDADFTGSSLIYW